MRKFLLLCLPLFVGCTDNSIDMTDDVAQSAAPIQSDTGFTGVRDGFCNNDGHSIPSPVMDGVCLNLNNWRNVSITACNGNGKHFSNVVVGECMTPSGNDFAFVSAECCDNLPTPGFCPAP